MLFATFLLGAGAFIAVFARRFNIDLKNERDFRAQLSGTHFDKHPISLG